MESKRVNAPVPSAYAHVPKNFRRLKWNELVSVGDFVADERRGLEVWEGPSGFRADSFVKAIYRRAKSRTAAIKIRLSGAPSKSPKI
jgi:hypothetical protein